MNRLTALAATLLLASACSGLGVELGRPLPASNGASSANSSEARRAVGPPAVAGYHPYIVQSGDTLASAAAQFGLEVIVLAEANGIPAPYAIYTGQTLWVPGPVAASQPTAPVEAAAVEAPAVDGDATAAEVAPPAAPSGPVEESRAGAEPAQAAAEGPRRARPLEWYDEAMRRPGGPIVVAAFGVAAAALAIQSLAWLLYMLRMSLVKHVPRLAAATGRLLKSAAMQPVYALGWLGYFAWLPVRWAWRRCVRPGLEWLRRGVARIGRSVGSRVARVRRDAASRLASGSRWIAGLGRRAVRATREAVAEQASIAAERIREGAAEAGRAALERWSALAVALGHLAALRLSRRRGLARRARASGEEADGWPPSEGTLLQALRAGEIVVDFRPVVAVDGGSLEAVESALRWERPGFGAVREQRLLAAVERPGHARIQHGLLEAQLREGARVLAAARAGRHPELRVSLPLTRSQFGDPALVSVVRGALEEFGAPPSALEIGIEERAAVADLDVASAAIRALRALEVQVTLRGYGSLEPEQVRRLGVTEVTVDFWGSVRDRGTEDFVKDTVRSAHDLGLTVTATGAETPEEVVLVKELGCQRVQGDAFGTPKRASAFTRSAPRAAA